MNFVVKFIHSTYGNSHVILDIKNMNYFHNKLKLTEFSSQKLFQRKNLSLNNKI